jgi:hypothetical protein
MMRPGGIRWVGHAALTKTHQIRGKTIGRKLHLVVFNKNHLQGQDISRSFKVSRMPLGPTNTPVQCVSRVK